MLARVAAIRVDEEEAFVFVFVLVHKSLKRDGEQDEQHDGQEENHAKLSAQTDLFQNISHLSLRRRQSRVDAVDVFVQVLQHFRLRRELLADGQTDLSDARYARRYVVQILILPSHE